MLTHLPVTEAERPTAHTTTLVRYRAGAQARDALLHSKIEERPRLGRRKKTMECEFFEANGGAAAR